MKNAFLRAGYTCVSMLIAGGLMYAAAPVKVTLPHAVTVGNTILPTGEYTISSLDMANGDEYFVVRSAHGTAITLQAQKVVSTDEAANTEVVFSKAGDTWHFDKMFIQGQDASYQFVSVK